MTRRIAVAGLALLGALLLSSEVFAQCAMCRRALLSPEGQQMVTAFRSGILVLLAAPFLVFGAVAVLALRAQRRSTAFGPGGAEESDATSSR